MNFIDINQFNKLAKQSPANEYGAYLLSLTK